MRESRYPAGTALLFCAILAQLSYSSPTPTSPSADAKSLDRRYLSIPNYIVCPAQVPAPGKIWPPGRNSSDYKELPELCSASDQHKNMGCFCSEPTSSVECHSSLADRLLYQSVPLRGYCLSECFCTEDPQRGRTGSGGSSASEAGIANLGTSAWHDDYQLSHFTDNGDTLMGASSDTESDDEDAGHQCSSCGSSSSSSSPNEEQEVSSSASASASRPVGPPVSMQAANSSDAQSSCPAQCSHDNPSCGGAVVDGQPCRCVASPTSAGSFFFSGLCRSSMKKRDVMLAGVGPGGGQAVLACACNGTYVSERCCDGDVVGGLVWEEPWKKLGILVP